MEIKTYLWNIIQYKIYFNSNSTTNSGSFWKLQFQFQSFEKISIPIPVIWKDINSNSNSGNFEKFQIQFQFRDWSWNWTQPCSIYQLPWYIMQCMVTCIYSMAVHVLWGNTKCWLNTFSHASQRDLYGSTCHKQLWVNASPRGAYHTPRPWLGLLTVTPLHMWQYSHYNV